MSKKLDIKKTLTKIMSRLVCTPTLAPVVTHIDGDTSIGDGHAIPKNANLDDYTTIGYYACISDVNAATITNSPASLAFRMEVDAPTGYLEDDGSDGYLRQTVTLWKNARVYTRTKYGANAWSGWTTPESRLSTMLKMAAFTSTKTTVNANTAATKTVTITVPSGYEFVGIIGVNTSHNYAGTIGGFHRSSPTQATVYIANRSSTVWNADTTVSVYVLFAMSNIY